MPLPETIPAPLAAALAAKGYDELTPVQAAVTAEEAAGRDLLVSAQTGSGKTVAFGLAFAGELLADGALPRPGAPLALAIAPTRELALQVARELEWLYAEVRARVVTCVGGMDAVRERRALNGGAHIVVGTPGRLRDHLERGALDLSSLRAAVLDEADEMLDMGFREELEAILDATPAARRTLMFSATMPKPAVALARRYQRDALRLETAAARERHADIEYQAVAVAPNDVEAAAVNLLRWHDAPTAILFCATRDAVRRLHASLTERGFEAVALSGEHSQTERNHALQALRDGRAKVCVATDVAARGIDLPNLSLVIHVELPRDEEALRHRSGRTGRAGRKGVAALIVPFQRRRRVDAMLRGAGVQAAWIKPPTPVAIAEKDRERLLAALLAPAELDEEDRALGATLLAERGAEQVAALLARSARARLPAVEELHDGAFDAGEGRGEGRAAPQGFEASAWFRADIGRRHGVEPRWMLPLLCRRGHVPRSEIGAIRVAPAETLFEVRGSSAARFLAAARRTFVDGADDEHGVTIQPAGQPNAVRAMRPGGARRGNDVGVADRR